MAIMTPRGLKVRFPPEFAFSLMGDMWERDPRTDAFRVLKTCEAISLIPSALAYCTGMAVAAGPTLAWAVLPAIIGGKLAGEMITRAPMLRLPGVVLVGLVWSCIDGYGVLLLLAALLTYHQNGVPGIAYWIAGSLAAGLASTIIAFIEMRRLMPRFGVALWDSEQRFMLACHLHARRLNMQLDVDGAGIDNPNWRFCLLNYAGKYPRVVSRHQCMLDAYDLAMGRRPAPPPPVPVEPEDTGVEEDGPDQIVGDWPFTGRRRVWVPGRYYNPLTAVAIPEGVTRLDRRTYLDLLATRYAWAARRDDWSVGELRRRAEQLCPDFSHTCELDRLETIDDLCDHIVNSWQGQQALNRAYAFDTTYHISDDGRDLEELILETNVEALLFELTTADTT